MLVVCAVHPCRRKGLAWLSAGAAGLRGGWGDKDGWWGSHCQETVLCVMCLLFYLQTNVVAAMAMFMGESLLWLGHGPRCTHVPSICLLQR